MIALKVLRIKVCSHFCPETEALCSKFYLKFTLLFQVLSLILYIKVNRESLKCLRVQTKRAVNCTPPAALPLTVLDSRRKITLHTAAHIPLPSLVILVFITVSTFPFSGIFLIFLGSLPHFSPLFIFTPPFWLHLSAPLSPLDSQFLLPFTLCCFFVPLSSPLYLKP